MAGPLYADSLGIIKFLWKRMFFFSPEDTSEMKSLNCTLQKKEKENLEVTISLKGQSAVFGIFG